MKVRDIQRVTPQAKMISVNNRFGNKNFKKQQGSTIEIYDSLVVDGTAQTLRFFLDAQNRAFPLTNLTKGQLQPEESFVMERMTFALAVQDDATGDWLSVDALDLAGFPGFNMAEVGFQIENNVVLKPVPTRAFAPEFNPAADNDVNHVFEFDSQLVIPPLLSFQATVRLVAGWFTPVAGQTAYLICQIGGAGGIFAPKNNF